MSTHNQLIKKVDKHRQAGRLSHAARLLKQALETTPAEVELLKRLGQITWQQKQYPESLAYFQQATDIDPNNAIAHNNLALLLYEVLKNCKSAKKTLSHCCRE